MKIITKNPEFHLKARETRKRNGTRCGYKFISEEFREFLRQRMLGNTYTLGMHVHTKEEKEKRRQKMLNGQATYMNGFPRDPGKLEKLYGKTKQRMLNGGASYMNSFSRKHSRPNVPETKILNILNKEYPNEWKYVGNSEFWLGNRNPDFMNINGRKKLIELYGDYWHKGQNPQERIRHFKKYGFGALVIWERELKNKGRIIEKIKDFCK